MGSTTLLLYWRPFGCGVGVASPRNETWGLQIFLGFQPCYPLVNIKKLLKIAIAIVDFPIKHGDFP